VKTILSPRSDQSVNTTQCGTVEIFRVRIYPLDPETGDHPLSTEVVVQPGIYPLYREMDAYYWMMTGRINGRVKKICDDMFAVQLWDEASGPEVTFPSRRYGVEQWADLKAEPTCTDEHPDQRIRIRA
jgi:hypothetical protein